MLQDALDLRLIAHEDPGRSADQQQDSGGGAASGVEIMEQSPRAATGLDLEGAPEAAGLRPPIDETRRQKRKQSKAQNAEVGSAGEGREKFLMQPVDDLHRTPVRPRAQDGAGSGMDENLEVRIAHGVETRGLKVGSPSFAGLSRKNDLKALVRPQAVPRETDDMAIRIPRLDGVDHQVKAGGRGAVSDQKQARV